MRASKNLDSNRQFQMTHDTLRNNVILTGFYSPLGRNNLLREAVHLLVTVIVCFETILTAKVGGG